jgi:hypothetical protein
MGFGFGLYYLGLFGRVDGPLRPERLAAGLRGAGVTRGDVVLALGAATLLALSWDRLWNLGRRLCGVADGSPARKGTAGMVVWLVCAAGFAVALRATLVG